MIDEMMQLRWMRRVVVGIALFFILVILGLSLLLSSSFGIVGSLAILPTLGLPGYVCWRAYRFYHQSIDDHMFL